MEVVRTRERGGERERGTATIMPCAKRVDVVAFGTQRKNMRVQRNCVPFYGIIQNLIRSYRDSLSENPIRIFDLMIFRSKGSRDSCQRPLKYIQDDSEIVLQLVKNKLNIQSGTKVSGQIVEIAKIRMTCFL